MNVEIKTRFFETPAGKLHYKEAGNPENKTLMFLHGFPEFWYSWRKQIEYFSQNYHVIAPDMRGYNKSPKPQKVKDYMITEIAGDIIRLTRFLNKEKINIIGHDWGAAITWHLALMQSDLFSKAVVLNVPHPLVFKKTVFSNPRQFLKSWYMFYFQIPYLPLWSMRRNRYHSLGQQLQKTSLEGSFSESDLEKYKEAWARENALKYMIMWYKAAVRNTRQANLYQGKQVDIPLKIIWGKNDVALTPKMAKDSLDYCMDGNLTYLENATHWVHQDCPEEVNQLIEKFIG